jgi:hypothetical protein
VTYKRQSDYYLTLLPPPIYKDTTYVPPTTHPIITEDVFSKPQVSLTSSGMYKRGLHLLILVHGLQGNVYDVRLLRHAIHELLPDAIVLSSATNENFTEASIFETGARLAKEVSSYIDSV